MLRVTSLNANGLRAAFRKGLADWLAEHQPNVVCLQELKAQVPDLKEELRNPHDYTGHFHCAEKRGYSGVGLYLQPPGGEVEAGLDIEEFDSEGRLLWVRWPGLTIASAYLPSGTSSEDRQALKMRFLDAFSPWLQARMHEYETTGQELIVCGDWNIAHNEIDLKNWRGNRKNSGFLPEERAWLDHVFDEIGLVDVFRQLEPGEDHYTWWSNRGQAWAKNVGWRIDYHIATPGIAARASNPQIYKDERFSDHAPLTIDYDWEL